MTFVSNIKVAFDASATEKSRDSGALAPSIIIMVAGFAIMAILAINWLSTAVLKKVADDATCIEGANTATAAAQTTAQAACTNDSGGIKSFTTDTGYQGRK